MKAMIVVAVAMLLGFASAPLAAQNAAKGKQKSTADSSPSQASSGQSFSGQPLSVAGPTYVIGADDVLLISVWKEPDLTITLPVRPDGNISMPLLNDVPAAGLSPTQLAASITEKLKRYVADPRVTVIVTQINSQKVYVTGEVLHTGAIQLLPNMTVLQALADAGFTQFANTKGIYVLRDENGRQQKIPVNYKRLVKGQAIDQNIILKPGDTIVVP
ncbi:MAG TPA: polysaccharide biosynthesis/export family protein [Terriglobales bacterium]|nr:polysaccharide biosynthesis/export family protein [Terriglobales bacterium]